MPLFVLMLLWGLLELFVIIIVADMIGALATIALLIGGLILGSWLIRGQQTKWLTMMQSQSQLNGFDVQSLAMKDGMFRMIAGVFFILPGFLTDLMALIFLVPTLRRLLGQQVMKLFKVDVLASKFAYRSRGDVYEHDDTTVEASDEEGNIIQGTLENRNFNDR